MQRTFGWILAIVLLATAASHGQSLGDVARENREKKAENASASTAPAKVLTNQDLALAKDPDANQGPNEAAPAACTAAGSDGADQFSARRLADQRRAEHRAAERQSAEQRLAQQRAAEQWKRQILAHKTRMATLQARIDHLHALIRSAGGSGQSDGPPYNRYQMWQLEQVAQIQQELDEQKRELDRMQDEARHAGMRSAVYDP